MNAWLNKHCNCKGKVIFIFKMRYEGSWTGGGLSVQPHLNDKHTFWVPFTSRKRERFRVNNWKVELHFHILWFTFGLAKEILRLSLLKILFIFVKQGLTGVTSCPAVLNFFRLENLLTLETYLDRHIPLLKHKHSLGQPSLLIKKYLLTQTCNKPDAVGYWR